jgi:hypothetical protein
MKKIISSVSVICILFTSTPLFAQVKNSNNDAATTKGDLIFDFGIGIGGGDYNGFNHYNNNWNGDYSNTVQIPTLSLSLQKAFWDDITIGGEIAFNKFGSEHNYHQSDDYYQHSKYDQTNTYVLARGEYHFNRLIGLDSKYDLYAGAVTGLRISIEKQTEVYEGWGTRGQSGSWRKDYSDASYSNVGPYLGAMAGFRLYFAKNMAAYAEVGWAVTNLRAGLAWRL